MASDKKRAYDRAWRKIDFARNPEKYRARRKAWSAKNPEKLKIYRERHKPTLREVRNANYVREYGLSYGEVEAMLASQEGMCAVCDAELEFPGPKAHVDHDHKTGAVRGMLCAGCNSVLGYAKDDEFILRRAAAYLLHHRRHPCPI